jgi:predicted aspartyl protease
MKNRLSIPASLAALLYGTAVPVVAEQFDARIPMSIGSAATYYVQARFGALDATDFLVDTGSGFLTINRSTVDALVQQGLASFKRDLPGVLADGTEVKVPVYQISQFSIGPCQLRDVEAVVFPATNRQIVGLNVLNRSAPFIFSVNPPELVLSHCTEQGLAEAEVIAPPR